MNTTAILEELLRSGRVSGISASIGLLVVDNGLSAAEIAETLSLDEAGIAAILVSEPMQKFIARAKAKTQIAVTSKTDMLSKVTGRDVCEEAVDKIRGLMHTAESEDVQLKSAVFLAEAAAGLKAPKEQKQELSTQEQIKLAFEQAFEVYKQNQQKLTDRVRQLQDGKVIEV